MNRHSTAWPANWPPSKTSTRGDAMEKLAKSLAKKKVAA
jgi:hypothetical protein